MYVMIGSSPTYGDVTSAERRVGTCLAAEMRHWASSCNKGVWGASLMAFSARPDATAEVNATATAAKKAG